MSYPCRNKGNIFVPRFSLFQKEPQIEVCSAVDSIDGVVGRHWSVGVSFQCVIYGGDVGVLRDPLGVGFGEILLCIRQQGPKTKINKCVVEIWRNHKRLQVAISAEKYN